MEVHVKGSPKIEVEFKNNIVKETVIQESGPFEKGSAENSAVLKGSNNEANGELSTAFGINTRATKEGEFVCGKFNVSDNSTLFSVGIGEEETPKNGFVVRTNGDIVLGSDPNVNKVICNSKLLVRGDSELGNGNDIITLGGKTFVKDIGGYDGVKVKDSDKSIAHIINNKAEKTDIVQSDWNQNSYSSKSFIENRTHYIEESITVYTDTWLSVSSLSAFDVVDDSVVKVIKPINIVRNGSCFGVIPENYIFEIGETFTLRNGSVFVAITLYEDFELHFMIEDDLSVVNYLDLKIVKTLPSMFIDSDIARTSQLNSKADKASVENMATYINSLEARIAELENIISQITIKVE